MQNLIKTKKTVEKIAHQYDTINFSLDLAIKLQKMLEGGVAENLAALV